MGAEVAAARVSAVFWTCMNFSHGLGGDTRPRRLGRVQQLGQTLKLDYAGVVQRPKIVQDTAHHGRQIVRRRHDYVPVPEPFAVKRLVANDRAAAHRARGSRIATQNFRQATPAQRVLTMVQLGRDRRVDAQTHGTPGAIEKPRRVRAVDRSDGSRVTGARIAICRH